MKTYVNSAVNSATAFKFAMTAANFILIEINFISAKFFIVDIEQNQVVSKILYGILNRLIKKTAL